MATGHASDPKVVVRLRRGMDPRHVRVAIFSSMDEPDRIAPGRVLDAFVTAVEAGLFGGVSVAEPSRSVKLLAEHRQVADVLTARLSRMQAQAFAVIPAMVRASVRGAVGLDIVEQHPDERLLLVRSLDGDTEMTLIDVDWRIGFEAGEPGVSIRFHEPPCEAAVAKADRLFDAWTELVALGAFPAPDARKSAARLREITARDPGEIRARFEKLDCGHAAFEALFEGLDLVNAESGIERVTIANMGAR